jgi:hypothetical protein
MWVFTEGTVCRKGESGGQIDHVNGLEGEATLGK